MAARLKELLLSNSVDSIALPKGQVIVLDSSELVVQGFQKLLDNKILSAPVHDHKEGKYIGFLDIRDLISFCVFIHDSNLQVFTYQYLDLHSLFLFISLLFVVWLCSSSPSLPFPPSTPVLFVMIYPLFQKAGI